MEVQEKSGVYCKDPSIAEKSLIWKKVLEEESSDTLRDMKFYVEVRKGIKSSDVIQEVDEIRDEMLSEVEELKKIADESKIRCELVQKKQILRPYMQPEIEKRLMRLSEILRENKVKEKEKEKENGENIIQSNKNLFRDLKVHSKNLRSKYRSLKLEYMEIEKIAEEKYARIIKLNNDLSVVQLENESLRSEISEITERFEQRPMKKSKSVCKKNSHSGSGLFKPTPSMQTMTKKHSIGCSPIYNSSFQSLTQFTKRNPSINITRTTVNYITGAPVRLIKLNK